MMPAGGENAIAEFGRDFSELLDTLADLVQDVEEMKAGDNG